MNFRVAMPHSLKVRLADLYLQAQEEGNGESFTAASNQIEQMLRANPTGVGESRSFPTRFLFLQPVSVHYEVDEGEQVVLILGLGYHPPR